jgi:hypothetical protein
MVNLQIPVNDILTINLNSTEVEMVACDSDSITIKIRDKYIGELLESKGGFVNGLKKGGAMIRNLVLSAALFFAWSETPASALGDLAQSMQPNSWAELTGTAGFQGGAILTRCVHSMLAFCNELKWDSAGRKVYILGSGHGDWASSNCIGFVIYDDASNAWTTLPKPPWYSQTPHGYDHTAFDQANRIIYHKTGFTENTFKYSIQTGQWTQIAGPFDQNVDSRWGGLEYYPELNALFWNREPYLLNLSTNRWEEIPNTYQNKTPSGEWTYNNYAEYDPVHRVMIYGGGNGSVNLYKLDASKKITKMSDTPFGMGINASIEFCDTRTGKFIVYREDGSNEMWTYDVTTDTWEKLPGLAPFLTNYDNWRNLVGGWICTYGVGFFVQWNGSNSKIYLYKPPAAATALNAAGPGPCMGFSVFPNPFGSSIAVRLPHGSTDAAIFDVHGKKVADLGPSLEWRPAGLSEGVYLLRITSGGRTFSRTLLYRK